MTPLAKWNLVYDRFDLELKTEERWIVPRSYSPTQDLIRILTTARNPQPVLLVGTMGSGKTTELQYISKELSQKHFVVFLDLHSHFSAVLRDARALESVQAWEICFLVSVALIKAAKAKYNHEFEPTFLQPLIDSWNMLAAATDSTNGEARQLNLLSLAKSMSIWVSDLIPGGALLGKLVEAAADSTSWEIPLGKSKRKLEDQEQPIRNLLDAVNQLVHVFHRKFNRHLVLVIDGLDRIRDREKAEELFRHSHLIASIDCSLVVCAPVAFRHSTALRETPFKTCTLYNEPVLKQSNPSEMGSGVDFFLDMYKRRTDDFGGQPLISETHLRKLAYCSGGRARDFSKLLRALAELTSVEFEPEESTDEMVNAVIRDARRDCERGLHKGHIHLLKEVINDEAHHLPEGDLALELLTDARLLPYPNESEWFYPHPLLTINLLK